jgi:heme/copper-type cytochrome/quinol oxidase subunit 3
VTVALVRYLGADVVRAQRWVAPLLAFLGGVAIFNVAGGPLRTTYADTATLLLAVSVWLTVVVVNSEDATQAAITAVSVGGDTWLRLGKLVTAWLGCAVLTGVALLWPLVVHSYTGRATLGDVVAGAVAHLLVGAFGVAVGSFGMRAVLPRAGWTVLFATGIGLADVLVPHAPPARRILELFDRPGGHAPGLLVVTAATALLVAALVATLLAVAHRRS